MADKVKKATPSDIPGPTKWDKAKKQKSEQKMYARMWRKCINQGGSKGECSDSANAYVKEHGPLEGKGLLKNVKKEK